MKVKKHRSGGLSEKSEVPSHGGHGVIHGVHGGHLVFNLLRREIEAGRNYESI